MDEIKKQIEELLAGQKQIQALLTQQTISEKYVNKEAACAFLNYGSSQLHKLLKAGKIEYSKIGRRVFISKDSLNQFLQKSIAD